VKANRESERKDYRRCEMCTEETNEKANKAKSAEFGCTPMGLRMFEMMNSCFKGQGGSTDCSIMMKGMMEAMGNHPCCSPGTGDAGSERREK
jgi:hypothetical protein